MRLVVYDNAVKFRDSRLNRSRDIRSQVIGGSIFDGLSAITSNQKLLVVSNVISGRDLEYVGFDVRVKFCDSMSSRYRDVRAAYSVMDDDSGRG